MDKVFAFFRGESSKLPNNEEFMKVYSYVLKQCDARDHNESLYGYFVQVVNEYLVSDLLPFIEDKTGAPLLEAFIKCWTDFAMFSKVIVRMFDYLNVFYLENLEEPLLGEKCLQFFNDVIYRQINKELRLALFQ